VTDEQKPIHKPERLTGQYVRMLIAPDTRKGILGEAKIERGRLEYLFYHDTRFDDVLPTIYVLESEVEPCPRPADAEVATINKLSKYGQS
jgi:hypothetical protein